MFWDRFTEFSFLRGGHMCWTVCCDENELIRGQCCAVSWLCPHHYYLSVRSVSVVCRIMQRQCIHCIVSRRLWLISIIRQVISAAMRLPCIWEVFSSILGLKFAILTQKISGFPQEANVRIVHWTWPSPHWPWGHCRLQTSVPAGSDPSHQDCYGAHGFLNIAEMPEIDDSKFVFFSSPSLLFS
jgi:hypothetical protein